MRLYIDSGMPWYNKYINEILKIYKKVYYK